MNNILNYECGDFFFCDQSRTDESEIVAVDVVQADISAEQVDAIKRASKNATII